MMEYDFLKLGDVETVNEVLNTDTVFVERNGSIYRADKSKVGGAGGYLLELEDEEIAISDDGLVVTKDVTDMIAAYQAANYVCLKFDLGAIEEDCRGAPCYVTLMQLIDASSLGADLAGMYIGVFCLLGETWLVYFTNGTQIPVETSASNLSLQSFKSKLTTGGAIQNAVVD